MAIDATTEKFLRLAGVGSHVLTLGRQHDCTGRYRFSKRPFADALLKRLGARSVESLDVSDYEGANYIHDLNEPVPENMRGRWDCIIDAGTLEHVFDIPQALDNCRAMLKPGGQLIVDQIGNINGHGFYCLTPELFFKWGRSAGFGDFRCWASYIGPFRKLFPIAVSEDRRAEIFSFLPFKFHLAMRCGPLLSANESTPVQAGPSMETSALRHWFRNTNIALRT